MFPAPLRREIVILLVAKAGALALIYFAFFAPAHIVSPPAVQAQLLSPWDR